MTEFTFTPSLSEVGALSRRTYTVEELDAEQGMFSCTPEFVREHGGPITLALLDLIPTTWYAEAKLLGLFPNIDVRVHRLYAGDYPAVPGWHCDGEFRADWDAQPDLRRNSTHSHLIATVSTDSEGVSLTEAVTEPVAAEIADGERVWESVHAEVERRDAQRRSLPDGVLHNLDSWTLHRATPARVRGWRLFFRASMWHKPVFDPAGGRLARQETVYRLSEGLGW